MKRIYKYNIGDSVIYRWHYPAVSCEWNRCSKPEKGKIARRTNKQGFNEYFLKGESVAIQEGEIVRKIKT